MNPVLSIIVPVYNVENYLTQCVDSILNQPFSDFELILIDDGSPDNCGAICDDYASQDNRVIVIHKNNGGLSSARNAGIDIATGAYLSFIDSDDFISEDYYQANMAYLLSHPWIDMTIMQVCYFDNKKNIINKNVEQEYLGNFISVGYLFSNDYICSSWINIYKKEVFDSIRFPNGKIFEDGYILPEIASVIKNIFVSKDGIYFYRQRENSIMRKMRSEKDWQDILESHLRMLDYAYQYPDSHMRFIRRYKNFSLAMIKAINELPNGNFEEYINKFQIYNFSVNEMTKAGVSFFEFIRLYTTKKFGFKFMAYIYTILGKR